MNDKFAIEQKQGNGSSGTQIVEQNNFYGMSPQEASQLAIQLFIDNFPRLQNMVKELVEEKVEELNSSLIQKMQQQGITDFSAFGTADVQYVLLKAQESYARFGEEDKLELLTDLLTQRIVSDDSSIVEKIAIDKAIEIAPFLTQKHLDMLALLFSIGQCIWGGIHTLGDLKIFFNELENYFPSADRNCLANLDMLNCLKFAITSPEDILSQSYNLDAKEIKNIITPFIKKVEGDYLLSNIGKVLAITHIKNKLTVSLDLIKFIEEK